MRKNCKECPYIVDNDNNHNKKFREISKKHGKHKCHMIKDGDFWKPTDENICCNFKKDNT